MLSPLDSVGVRLLRLILPEHGCYIATIKLAKSRGFRSSIFASTIEELWSIIENADRDGYEAYHACASFKEARNDPPETPEGQKQFGRTKNNARGAKAFLLDIDAGQGKPYSSQNEALNALASFCRACKLPKPIVVNSGWGLHVYWPLRVMLDRPTWEYYVGGLKNLCARHQLHADPARTADISSVLRTPGSRNRKRTPHRLVECIPEFLEIQPYEIECFEIFAANSDAIQPINKQPSPLFGLDEIPSHLLREKPPEIAHRMQALITHEPATALEVVGQCGQVRELRDQKGNLSEPLWYAAIGVLAFCEDGDQFAHEWSSGYEGYTSEETQARLNRARKLSGATTCGHFHSLNPEVCEKCDHWQEINSPIVLGRSPTLSALGTLESVTATPPHWEHTQGGALKPRSYINAAIALEQLGIVCRHDIFHNKKIIEGDVLENLGPELSDAICRALRDRIIERFHFDPGIENVQQAAERACEATRFDPVFDYLASQQWDGTPRLNRWVVSYLGATDTSLNRSIGSKMLIAAVRRVRQPGCKFDYVVVLEGKQGTGKSSALRILAGEENFSDQPILHLDSRAQQEAVEGVWICELSELAGLRRTEVETVKSFLSKTADNARPAYGRFRTDQARRCIFVGTTNDNEYLRDSTGNRRFWPLSTGKIDLEALRIDRDQLWAEASNAEASGEPLVIPEHLYGAVADQQEQRLVQDPWEDLLAGVAGTRTPSGDGSDEERISSTELMGSRLQLSPDKQTDVQSKRLRHVMNRLGWRGPKKMRIGQGAKSAMGYWRPVSGESRSE